MSYVRTIVASLMIGSGLVGCSHHNEIKERTKAALTHLEKIDNDVSKEVVALRLANHGRYLAQTDIRMTPSFEEDKTVHDYYQKSFGKDEEYTLFLTSKAYLEEANKNKSISNERFNHFNSLFQTYEKQDLISRDKLPSLSEVRCAVLEHELIESYYKTHQISDEEYKWFNNEAWVRMRTPFKETEKTLRNLTSSNTMSKELREAFLFSKDYNVANKIFDIHKKELLTEEDTINILSKLDDYFKDSRESFRLSYIDGKRAQFLLENVFLTALEVAKEKNVISEKEYKDLQMLHKRDLQNPSNIRAYSTLFAKIVCLNLFEKLGIDWKFNEPSPKDKGEKVGKYAFLERYNEPFRDNYSPFIIPPENPSKPPEQVISGK